MKMKRRSARSMRWHLRFIRWRMAVWSWGMALAQHLGLSDVYAAYADMWDAEAEHLQYHVDLGHDAPSFVAYHGFDDYHGRH